MEDKGKKAIYWLLIGTFALLYFFVAFVSLLHAIEFFGLANNKTLSIMLASAYEIGQASILFSLLITQNKHRLLAWSMMILLTSLQVTANVFASFKFMDLAIANGNIDWTYWQRSILFWMDVSSPEMYKVIISWIIGALLPIVALGMTALVADNIKMMTGGVDLDLDDYEENEYVEEVKEPNIFSETRSVVEKWRRKDMKEGDTIKFKSAVTPPIDAYEEDQYWLKDPVEKDLNIVTDEDTITDFDDIQNKGIDEIIEESVIEEPDGLKKK